MSSTKNEATKPVIGIGATLYMYSDRHAYTIVAISPKGNIIDATKDISIRVDSNGMSEMQEYIYKTDTYALIETFQRRKNGCYYNASGVKLVIGERHSYHDFSF